MLDAFFISVFNHYKKTIGKRSLTIALLYINLLELSLVLALATFFMAFASQMKMQVMSTTKFWVLMVLVSIFIIFMNWMRYNGKKRTILNAKSKRSNTPIYLLWLVPIACFAIAAILLQV